MYSFNYEYIPMLPKESKHNSTSEVSVSVFM